LVGVGLVLVGGAGDDDEPALGVILVHGLQDRLLVYVAAVFWPFIGHARCD
jgi:hypothetical protein